MLTPRPVQRGVSLIELMVGLAIAALLLGMAAPSFGTFLQNSRIRTAAEAIQNGLNLARAEAVRRNTNVQFELAEDFSWTVGCATPSADDISCPQAIQSRAAAEGSANVAVETAEVSAANGAAAATPAFTGTLVFNGLGRATTLPAGNNARFNISYPDGGACVQADGKMRCLRVEVTSAGQVRMCDPALTSGAQAC